MASGLLIGLWTAGLDCRWQEEGLGEESLGLSEGVGGTDVTLYAFVEVLSDGYQTARCQRAALYP